jgi:hypothetical protein
MFYKKKIFCGENDPLDTFYPTYYARICLKMYLITLKVNEGSQTYLALAWAHWKWHTPRVEKLSKPRWNFGCHDSEHSNGHISLKNYSIITSNIFGGKLLQHTFTHPGPPCVLTKSPRCLRCHNPWTLRWLSHKTKISLSKILDFSLVLCWRVTYMESRIMTNAQDTVLNQL